MNVEVKEVGIFTLIKNGGSVHHHLLTSVSRNFYFLDIFTLRSPSNGVVSTVSNATTQDNGYRSIRCFSYF